MATFVLVHGAWGGAWMYRKTANRLRAAGHDVFAVDLTGLGARGHLAHGGITLSDHVADVTTLITEEKLDDVILVGHSYGGMVVTGAAGVLGGRIRTLVYLDAFLPRDGEALWDIADDRVRPMYIDGQRDTPGLLWPIFIAPDAELPPGFHRHPLLTLTQALRFTGREREVRNHSYIYATRGAPTQFTGFADRVRGDAGWRVHDVDTGHQVMIDDPEGLADLLLSEVDR